MKVTQVKIIKSERGMLKAFASVTIDDALVIHSIRIIQTDKKTFVAMPSKPDGKGEFRDIVHPITQSLREMIEKAVMDEYLASSDEEKPKKTKSKKETSEPEVKKKTRKKTIA